MKEREEMISEQISSFPCLRKHRRTSNENMYVDSRTNGIKWLGLPFDRNETSDVLWTRSHGQRTGVEKSWNTHQLLQDFFVQKSFTASWKCLPHSYLSHCKLCFVRSKANLPTPVIGLLSIWHGKFGKYFSNNVFVLKNIIVVMLCKSLFIHGGIIT